MLAFLARILELRNHPSRRVRRLGWAALGATAGLILAPTVTGILLFAAWMAFNLGLQVTAVGWAMFHPKALARAVRPAATGSFWLALLTTAWISSSLTVLLSERMPEIVTPLLRTTLVLGAPVVLVVLLVIGFGLALAAAAIGAYTTRRHGPPEAATLAVGAGWLVFLGLVLVGAGGELLHLPEMAAGFLVGSGPAAVALLTASALRAGSTPAEVRERGMEWLARRLIRRWEFRGKPRRLDLRGAALGLAASLVGAVLAVSPALLPLQTQVLVSSLRLRNSIENAAESIHGLTPPAHPVRVALLELDFEARRRTATTGSEAGVQAQMIRKLSDYGARLVLPLPVVEPLNPGQASAVMQTRGRVTSLPTEADVRRSLADLDVLAAACRRSGGVFLGLPAAHTAALGPQSVHVLERLSAVTAGVGRADLEAFGAPELPVLTTTEAPFELDSAPGPLARAFPPLPLLLTSGPHGAEAMRGLPRIAADKVLVSVRATQPEQSFPRISYGSVLRGEPLLVPAAEARKPAGRWVSPQEFFQGRTVFLDSLLPHARDTVAGRMPQAEVLAHALATLQSRTTTSRAPLAVSLLALVLAGLVTGGACTGRSPLHAVWIAGGLELGALATSAVAFLAPVAAGAITGRGVSAYGSIWLDPVAPMLVVLATYLLSANLTLAVERAQRERNKSLLQRFVAPQVVEELLVEMGDFGNDLGLGGKRQQVCVLFADVRGFTRFAEAHPPEVVIEITNRYLTALTEALHRHGGLLDKYLGDGLMALFRVQDPDSDIRRAVHAALAMRDAAAAVSVQQLAQDLPVLQVGISLHYGEAVVGLVGNPAQFNYTALGHTVVVTQRLQSVAGAGEVILSETVFAAVQGHIDAETGTPVTVKGLSQPVCYYRIPNPCASGQKAEGSGQTAVGV